MNFITTNYKFFAVISIFYVSTSVFSGAYASPVITELGNKMVGIKGIDIAGSVYDLSWGTTWGGEMESQAFAIDSARALLGLFAEGGVFHGTVFDLDPLKTAGCTNTTSCRFRTVYSLASTDPDEWNGISFSNRYNANDIFDTTGSFFNQPLSVLQFDANDAVYARWSEVTPPSAIPIPAAIWLMGSGLIGLLGFGRKKKAVAA